MDVLAQQIEPLRRTDPAALARRSHLPCAEYAFFLAAGAAADREELELASFTVRPGTVASLLGPSTRRDNHLRWSKALRLS